MKTLFPILTLVTNKKNTSTSHYLEFISQCIEGGISAVQLREKYLSPNELYEFGKSLQTLLKPHSIPLIINDSLELTIQLNADGVHLGQSDGNILAARKKLGEHKIIGLTVDNFTQLETANILPIDYIGIGTIFPTNNKPNITQIWGLDGLKKIRGLSKHKIIAIGGINENNALSVIQAGAHGLAGIDIFHTSLDPTQTIKNLRKIMEKKDHV